MKKNTFQPKAGSIAERVLNKPALTSLNQVNTAIPAKSKGRSRFLDSKTGIAADIAKKALADQRHDKRVEAGKTTEFNRARLANRINSFLANNGTKK